MRTLSNLPPGVTDRMIEEQSGPPCWGEYTPSDRCNGCDYEVECKESVEEEEDD